MKRDAQKFIIRNQGTNHESRCSESNTADFPKGLGLIWDSELDIFRFSVEINPSLREGQCKINGLLAEDIVRSLENREQKFTKRSELSKINSIFDPLGLASNLLQEKRLQLLD